MTHKLGIDNLSVTRLTYTRGDSGGWTLDWLNRSLCQVSDSDIGTGQT